MLAGRVEKMGKRKRNAAQEEEELGSPGGDAEKNEAVLQQESAIPQTIQIIIGTYEKVLHGITASIRSQANQSLEQNCVDFADSFLLNAHTSAIRCLAVRMALSSLIQKSTFAGSNFRRKTFGNICASLVLKLLPLRSVAEPESYLDFALDRSFQIAENSACQWQFRPSNQSLPLINDTTANVSGYVNANPGRQH